MAQQSESHLVWMDLEMTGLDPDRDTILEIATLITDNRLVPVADGPVLAIHQPPAVLSRMDAWNQEHHGASGLTERVVASTLLTPARLTPNSFSRSASSTAPSTSARKESAGTGSPLAYSTRA